MLIINKSKRTIDGILPLKVTEITIEKGERLLRMYVGEIEKVKDETSLQGEVSVLKSKISKLERENKTLKDENKTLNDLLEEKTDGPKDCGVEEVKKVEV